MKKIGMIGGLSWVSTAEYYRLINEYVQLELGGVNSAHLILESVNRQEFLDAVIESADESAARQLTLNAARVLERAGAAFIVICCNSVHRFVSQIETDVSIPFLHIATATARAIQDAKIKSVALMGARQTMEDSFYPDILKQHGIATILPNDAEMAFIHESINDELVRGVFHDATRGRYIDLTRNLYSRGAGGVVLGCTEIPSLLRDDDVEVTTFSTTEIHCRAAVELALSA